MIVFLHGYTGSAASWDVVRARLSPSTPSRCEALLGHAPELVLDGSARGHSFAGEVERLAERLRSDGPVHLVGYSLGARLALAIAVAHPDRVGRLTLLSVHPGLRSPVERTARTVEDEGWARLLEEQGLPGFLAAWDARPLFASRARLPPRVSQLTERTRRLTWVYPVAPLRIGALTLKELRRVDLAPERHRPGSAVGVAVAGFPA